MCSSPQQVHLLSSVLHPCLLSPTPWRPDPCSAAAKNRARCRPHLWNHLLTNFFVVLWLAQCYRSKCFLYSLSCLWILHYPHHVSCLWSECYRSSLVCGGRNWCKMFDLLRLHIRKFLFFPQVSDLFALPSNCFWIMSCS
jgi:hypothetical protein